jgi:predicted Zn-dependent peptidase
LTQTLTLENGLTLLCAPQSHVAGVSLELFVPAGAITETVEGGSSVLEEWLWRGAGALGSRALEDALDDLGVRRESEVSAEGMLFSFACLPEDAGRVLGMMADIALHPRLEDAEFRPSVLQARSALEGLQDAPDESLFTLLTRAFFVSAHGRSPFGTLEGLRQLTPQSVRADHAARFTPRGSILAMSGNLEPERFFALAERAFSGWRGGRLEVPEVEMRAPFYEHHRRMTAQTHVALMFDSVAFTVPGYYESRFVVETLSGTQSNRLFNEVRERRGLAYSVHANTTFYAGGSTLELYAGTTPERAQQTLEVLMAEMARLTRGITEAEFERARVGILTSLALFEESSSGRATSLIRDWRLLGRTRELEEVRAQVEAVTLEGVNAWLASEPWTDPGVMTLGRKKLELRGGG